MNKLNELQKQIICDKLDILTDNLNDDELDYAIYILKFWKEERERQNKEIDELYGKVEE